MAEFEFKLITTYSNWCEKDQLDGQDLHDGELLEMLWPNGDREVIKISVVSSSYTVSDMGKPATVSVSRAHHKSYWKKIPIMVPIVGMRARRVLQ